MVLRSWEARRRLQLEGAVLQHLQNVAPKAATVFEEEMAAKGHALMEVPKEADALYKKWCGVGSLQIKVDKLEKEKVELLERLKFYDNLLKKPTHMASGGLPKAPPMSKIRAHQQSVRAIAFHPFLPLMASAGDDYVIKIWDCEEDIKLHMALRGHSDLVDDLMFNPTGEWLASAGFDSDIRLWDLKGQKFVCAKVLRGHTAPVSTLAFLVSVPHRLLSAGKDKAIRVWDTASGLVLNTYFDCHRDWIRTIQAAPSECSLTGETLVASAGNDQMIKVWKFRDDQLIPVDGFVAHEHIIESLCFATVAMLEKFKAEYGEKEEDTARNDFSSLGRRVTSMEPATRTQLSLKGDEPRFKSPILFSSSRDRLIKMWDVLEGKCLKSFEGHKNWVKKVIVNHKGNAIISCSDDKSIRSWDVLSGSLLGVLDDAHQGFVNCIALGTRSLTLASGGIDCNICVWDCVEEESN